MAVDAARAKSLFLAASDLADPARRAAYLDRECGGDAELRARVEALLRADDASPLPAPEPRDAAGTFAPDAPAGVPTADRPDKDEHAGAVIAAKYKLVEEIGEGGMGAVWMARQAEPVRRFVAVKLIKAGADSRAVLARFEAERQALALMDHPNIARVFDAGSTPEGRPFFVMELIKGVPITQFCDDRRLTCRERLGLFVPVCQAIQHAHQKGVIHRDIKPSNVLVALSDDRPVPKVIDFGVAKATGQPLTEKTLATGFGAVVGTPEYMSPEQAGFNNLDIDTRSDVYALGALLYELLAGSPPFSRKELEDAGLLEILRVVREVEPPRPSAKLSAAAALPALSARRGTEPAQLTRSLRGELDWIVMKALEKDRSRRYDSANSFAADVQRHLAGEPVEAVPPSAGYRLRKFVKRNRAAVLAAGVLAVVLLAAAGVSLAFGLLASRAEGIAEQRRLDAEANEAKAVQAGGQLRDARDELWAGLYAARCPLIQGAWDAGRYDRVRELLAAQVPAAGRRDHRGFEWYYLDRQINADLRTVVVAPKDADDDYTSSPDRTPLLRLSPDGTRLLRFTRSGDDRRMLSYDTTTGREQFAVRYPAGVTYGASYSADGKWIVAAAKGNLVEGELRRWDAATGAEDRRARGVVSDLMPLAGPDALPAVWQGRRGPPSLQLWDGKAVKAINQPRASQSNVLALNRDGTLLAVSKDGAVELIDTRTGQPLSKAGDPPIPPGNSGRGAPARAAPVAFSTDGKRLAVAGEKLTVWEVAPRRRLAEVAEQARHPVFSPDGARIAYVRGPDAVIAEAATGRVRRVIKGHDGGIEYVAFTRDGSVLVTAGLERVEHWDATIDERVPAIRDRADKPADEPTSASPDGRRVGRFDDPELRVWGLADDSLVTFKVPPLPERTAKPGPDDIPNGWGLKGCVFSPDGRRVTMGNPTSYSTEDLDKEDAWESALRLWDLDAGRQLMVVRRLGAVTERVFSPDGRLLAAVFDPPGEVMVWDASSSTKGRQAGSTEVQQAGGRHRYTLKLPRGHNFMLAFSTDGGRVVAVGGAGDTLAVALWDAETGQPAPAANVPYGREQGRHRFEWFPPALGPGGRRVAAFVRKDAVSVWDTATGGHLIELKGVNGLAPNTSLLAFSPDGRRLATCGQSGGLKLWDPDTGTELLSLQVPVRVVHHLAFTPDGHGIRLVVQTEAGFETRLLGGSPRPEPRKP
jgi:serine/threonine protein kinase/WD40 repeat protein